MKSETQNLLRRIKERLPENKQAPFANAIRARIAELDSIASIDTSTVAKYTIGGMLAGAVLDLIPGVETLAGVEGFVDIGAAVGGFVGLAKSEQERRAREQVRGIIIEELNRLATPS